LRPDPEQKDFPLTAEAAAASAEIFQRVTRNVGWLVIADGFRLASMAANILIARFLGAADFGIVALARETARYAALPSDLGIATYGQAEAARCPTDKLAELADEIVPARAVMGIAIYSLFALFCIWRLQNRTTMTVFLVSGIFVISETLRADWLFRGRERFDLVVAARAAEALSFLAIVVIVGSRPHAVVFDSIGWSASELLMASIWLMLLPKTVGRRVTLRPNFHGWIRHAADAIYVPIAVALMWGGWLILMWLVAWTGSRHEVGILAAPYGLTMSCVNMGIMLVMGFFPTSATLPRDSELFAEVRRGLTSAMLILSIPIATVGSIIAQPLILFLFGPAYHESVTPLLLLIWLAPLSLVRAAYGYTLVSSGLQRVFPLGPVVAFAVTVAFGIPLTLCYHSFGAALAALLAATAATTTTITVSWYYYGDASMPAATWLVKFIGLNLAVAVAGIAFINRMNWTVYLTSALAFYPLGLTGLQLIDIRETAMALFGRGHVVTSA